MAVAASPSAVSMATSLVMDGGDSMDRQGIHAVLDSQTCVVKPQIEPLTGKVLRKDAGSLDKGTEIGFMPVA